MDYQGYSLLHYAAFHCSLETLQYLDSLSLSGIDVNSLDYRGGSTPWDCFQFAIYASLGQLLGARRPSPQEEQAFASLYEGIRNRTAGQDITCLEQVLDALSQRDKNTAFSLLQTRVEEKRKWQSMGLYKWYRILARQVQEGELDAVVESIQDYIKEMRELIQSSAWDLLPSVYTPPLEPEENEKVDLEYESSEDEADSDGDVDEEDERPKGVGSNSRGNEEG
ncbi:hypothetical protein ACHAPT_009568 [Fusarium lateritium]